MNKVQSGLVVVVGSVNMDLMLRAPHLPRPGETVMGREFAQAPGGKGANQAVAAARLGARVSFVGCVGDDALGTQCRAELEASAIDVRHLYTIANEATGIAMIASDDAGENSIVLAPGANNALSCAHIDAAAGLFQDAEILVLQLESPLPTVLHAMHVARNHKVAVLLNPAPARQLPVNTLRGLDILVLNTVEAAMLSDMVVSSLQQASASAEFFRSCGVQTVIVTMGSDGLVLADDHGTMAYPAPHVKAVDSTGAGDTFVGALAGELTRGRSMLDAVNFAQRAAAFSVTGRGAQASMPSRGDFDTQAEQQLAAA